jgi:hypothetical protein
MNRETFVRAIAMVGMAGAAACGAPEAGDPDSGGGDDDAPDAAAVDGEPACFPAMPTPVGVESGFAAIFAGDPVLTSTGDLAVFVSPTNDREARIWNGQEWTSHVVFSNSNGGWSAHTAGEIDGHLAYLASIDNGSSDDSKLRVWEQLDSGDFATGQLVPGLPASTALATFARYAPATSVLSAAGADGNFTSLYSYQHSGTTWTTQNVHFAAGGQIDAAGVGALTDGTAIVSSSGSEGLWLHRRTGVTWSPYRQLASGVVIAGHVEFPPDGATGGSAIGVYVDPTTNHPRGVFASVTDGTPSGAADLVTTGVLNLWSDIVYAPDGDSGVILIWDDNAYKAWLVAFEGTSFLPAQELHPDRVFEARPRLLAHPCAGVLILHTSRLPTDPANSAEARIEPLATF